MNNEELALAEGYEDVLTELLKQIDETRCNILNLI